MGNMDIQAAWHYHDGTKHPNGHLMDPMHAFDPMRQPMLLKIYSGLEPIPLSIDLSPLGVPALSAISTNAPTSADDYMPDIGTLARVLHLSAGVTKKIAYPWGEMLFRAAACTGALYHIELYVVCRDLPGFEAGVYHFDASGPALRRLRSGDHRGVLVEACANEPAVAHAPATIVYTDVIWRNACKYQAREYRHAFWDSGTILAHTLAISSAHSMAAKVVAGFADDSVSRLLDLDIRREVALALVPLGYASETAPQLTLDVSPMSLETEPLSDNHRDFPAVREIHLASYLTTVEEVAAWRGELPPTSIPEPSGQLTPLEPLVGEELPLDPIERVIVRRGSTRRFAQEPITFQQLSTALQRSTQGIPADFLESPGASLNDAYLIVNAVDGLEPGAYVYHRDRQALELLRKGNFRREAGHLGLNQALPADAGVAVFFLCDLGPVLQRFGNRGYRAAQLDASIAAGRLYLAAYAQGLGATGLTFFDDDVTHFFSPHSQSKSVMFLVALGRRARRG